MCWSQDKQKFKNGRLKQSPPKPLVAEKPITVYKKVYRVWRDGGSLRNKYYSAIIGHSYKKGELNPLVKVDFIKCRSWWQVEAGYHSWKSLDVVVSKYIRIRSNFYENDTRIVRCTIPAGAKYWVADNGDVVSEQIIIGNQVSINELIKCYKARSKS